MSSREELRERIALKLGFEPLLHRDPELVDEYAAKAEYVIELMEQVREACALKCYDMPAERGGELANILARMPLPEPK